MKALWASLLTFVVMVAWSSGALSQESAQGAAEVMNAKGRGHYDAQEFAAALDSFKRAHARYPSARYLFNAAKACVRLQDREGAIFFFRRYLVAAPQADDRDQVLAEVETLRDELLAAGCKELMLAVTPTEAVLTPPKSQSPEVVVVPASFFMLPGSYQIALQAPDYERQWVTIDVAPDGPEVQTVTIALERAIVQPPVVGPAVEPVSRPFHWQWVMLGVGAAGVVAGGAGGYLWYDGWAGMDRANERGGPDYVDDYRHASGRYVTGQWLTAAGAAVAAAGVLGYVFWPQESQVPVPSVSLLPNQEGGVTFGFATIF